MNQNIPLVSVIMPCFNHEKYVADSLESIFNQTYKNLEVIIADNGSTDHTGEIIQEYHDKIDKIVVMNENNISKCEEILYSSCTGEYIAMAHSDDWWEPQKIEKQIKALAEHDDCDACFTWAIYTTENLNDICNNSIFIQKNRSRSEWQRSLFLNGNCLSHPSILVKRNLMLEIRNYMLACPRLGDWHAWLQMLRKTNIYVIEEFLVRMRRHNNNLSSLNVNDNIKEMLERSYMFDWMCTEYSDQEFTSIFAPDFVKKDAHTKEELFCERLFLLLREAQNNAFMVGAAYRMFCTSFLNPEIRKVMEDTYHYKRKDIAEFEENNLVIRLMRNEHENTMRENIQILENIGNKAIMLLEKAEQLFSIGEENKAENILLSMIDFAREIQKFLDSYWNNLQKVPKLQKMLYEIENQKTHSYKSLYENLKNYFNEVQNLLKEMKEM